MTKAEIFPSRIEISPYELGTDSYFEKKMSVFSKVTYSYDFSAFIYDEDEQKLIVPRNISNKITNSNFFKTLETIDRTNYFDEPRKVYFNMKNQPRDNVQAEAIDFLMAGNKYSDYTFMEHENEKMICLPTGKGKTFSVISYLAQTNTLGMIIVDQDTIMEQWYKEFINHTDISEEDIFLISGAESVKTLLTVDPSLLPFKVYIASHRTLHALMRKRRGKEIINTLFNHLQIGAKIFDEAHVEWKNIILLNSYVDTQHTIYLTATPSRSKMEEDIVYQYVFGEVPRYGYNQKFSDDEKYQHLVYVEYKTNPTIEEQAEMKNKHGFNMKAYSDYIQNKYMDYIYDILVDILNNHKGVKCAIIAHKNDLVQELYERLSATYEDRTVGRFCGLIKNKVERELETEKDIIISTDRSLGKAKDIMGLEVVISLNQYSSKVMAEQMVGRIRNRGGSSYTFYDFTDLAFEECRKQRNYRKKGLELKALTKETKKYIL